jgi:hypothetical protein
VKVFEGTEDDAFMVALKDNSKHGLPMSRGDLRFCIEKAVCRFPDKSPGVIAKMLGRSRSYVSEIVKEVSASGHVVIAEKRQGADGKTYSVKRKVKQPPAAVLEQSNDNPKSDQQSADTLATAPESLPPVIAENSPPKHLNESQRAMLAHDEWERSRHGNGKKKTLPQVAEEFNVSRKLVQQAGIVKEIASQSAQQSVRNGTISINKAIGAAKKEREATGITVLDDRTWRKKCIAFQSFITSLERAPSRISELESQCAGQEGKQEMVDFLKDRFCEAKGS